MLQCVSHHRSRAITEAAVEYFDELSCIPLSQRDPQLSQPYCQALLLPLLRQAAFPEGFRGWEHELEEDDEQLFDTFRWGVSVNAAMYILSMNFFFSVESCIMYVDLTVPPAAMTFRQIIPGYSLPISIYFVTMQPTTCQTMSYMIMYNF